MIKNNICFYVFHTKENKQNSNRNKCAENINNAASFFLNKLESSTFKIVDDEGIKDFLKNNKKFLLDSKGWDPSHRTFSNSYKKEIARPIGWTYGTIGIWASNYTAWKNFLDTEYEYLILFEDDVVIDENFFELMQNYLKLLPDNWDIFHHYAPKNTTGKNLKILEGKYPICKPYQSWSNAVYIISRKGAITAVHEAETNPVFLPVDWFFFKQQKLFNIYTLVPEANMGCKTLDIRSTHISQNFIDISHLVNDLGI